jgi:hypothetical protein
MKEMGRITGCKGGIGGSIGLLRLPEHANSRGHPI